MWWLVFPQGTSGRPHRQGFRRTQLAIAAVMSLLVLFYGCRKGDTEESSDLAQNVPIPHKELRWPRIPESHITSHGWLQNAHVQAEQDFWFGSLQTVFPSMNAVTVQTLPLSSFQGFTIAATLPPTVVGWQRTSRHLTFHLKIISCVYSLLSSEILIFLLQWHYSVLMQLPLAPRLIFQHHVSFVKWLCTIQTVLLGRMFFQGYWSLLKYPCFLFSFSTCGHFTYHQQLNEAYSISQKGKAPVRIFVEIFTRKFSIYLVSGHRNWVPLVPFFRSKRPILFVLLISLGTINILCKKDVKILTSSPQGNSVVNFAPWEVSG